MLVLRAAEVRPKARLGRAFFASGRGGGFERSYGRWPIQLPLEKLGIVDIEIRNQERQKKGKPQSGVPS